MEDRHYFINYKTDQTSKPYKCPEDIKKDLTSIEGLRIVGEGKRRPIVMASIPDDKLDKVKSLDSVIKVTESKKYEPLW